MADVSWNSAVRNSGVVKVDVSKVTAPGWKLATSTAIRQLNAAFKSNDLNVQLEAGDSAVVSVGLSAGKYKFPSNGKDTEGTLRTDILHGVTRGVDVDYGRGFSRERAYIFLPQHPKVDPQNPKSRDVGEPVMRVMVAHEFLHALGLDKHDAGLEGLMAGSWTLNEGGKAADDAVSPIGSTTSLPPLVLSAATWTRLKALW